MAISIYQTKFYGFFFITKPEVTPEKFKLLTNNVVFTTKLGIITKSVIRSGQGQRIRRRIVDKELLRMSRN